MRARSWALGVKQSTAVGAALAGAFLALGCRTSPKGVRVGAQAAEVKVNLSGQDSDWDAANLSYELTECVPTVHGTRDSASGQVSFKAEGLKRDMVCQVKVKTLATVPDVTFTGEDTLLYWAREVPIGEDARGQLVALARLAPQFRRVVNRPPGKAFTLSAPVTFTPQASERVINATIDCAPRIANVGTYSTANPANGAFEFVAEIGTTNKYQCTTLWVSVDGVGQKYSGKYDATGKFDAVADQKAELPRIAVTLTPVASPNAVTVTTTPGQCGADEVFNTVTRTCEKKPV